MPSRRPTPDSNRDLVEQAQRNRARREKGYRSLALKILPPVCAHCGREFTERNIHQLTVHHKDHNHDNNPADGSNWELLCIYCHENEHARKDVAAAYDHGAPSAGDDAPTSTYRPFADLDKLLKKDR